MSTQNSDDKVNRGHIDDGAKRRRERRLKRRRAMIIKSILLLLLAALLVVGIVFAVKALNSKDSKEASAGVTGESENTLAQGDSEGLGNPSAGTDTDSETSSQETQASVQTGGEAKSVLDQARAMAAGYDYDGAIELLKAVPGYESDTEITQAVSEFEAAKAACVPVDVDTVPHIFYHSLINDTDRAFNVSVLGQGQVDGMNAWMTTVEEFDSITQQMYDNGYVFVRLRDLVVETKNEDGSVTFEKNTNLLLPPDKKAVVLSVDDLSYYHSYKDAGYPEKLVFDENGKVKCRYTSSDGTEQIGDYDVVPRLNSFLEEHPDGAYKGARGMIALTGYDGVFGYRTDVAYKTGENLTQDQSDWLAAHPDFNWEEDVAEATKIADAIKESGWEFASHTWGHLSVTNKTVDELKTDNDKWVNTVQNIVGPVDIIIFAHGNDIGDWQDYSPDNEKFQFYKSAGYNFFCNVDGSTPYWVQIRENYVRQGRINLDGFMLYKASTGETDVLDNMFDASQVFDSRRPVPVVANGES